MKPSKLVAMLLAAVLMYKGYSIGTDVPVNPDTESVTVIYDEMQFPPAPTDPVVINILSGLDSVGISTRDAHTIAVAFSQWAEHVRKDTALTNVSQLTGVYQGAVRDLLSIPGSLDKTYGGKIDLIVQDVYKHSLKDLVNEDGTISSLDITPEVRAKLVGWLNAISWKCSDIFAKQLLEEEDEIPPQA